MLVRPVVADVPAYRDDMIGQYHHLAPALPIAVTFRHHADGRRFHAAYQVTAPYRGEPRVEVYGVMVLADSQSLDAVHDTWLPGWSLDEYWFAEPPTVATVAAAREGLSA